MAQIRVLVICLILGYVGLTVLAAYNKAFSGPFDVVVKQFADCENPKVYPAKWNGNKIWKLNRTTYRYSMDLYLPDEFDKSVKLTIIADILGNGGCRKNYFVLPVGDACSAYRTYLPGVKKAIVQAMGECPVPAGNYSIKDFVLDVTFNWPSFVYNAYRVNLLMTRMSKNYLCKRIFVDIVPKLKN